MAQDAINIEVLADGTIKVTTDQVSMPNHQNAEEFLRFMAELAGGKQTRVRKAGAHHHHHDHAHLGHGHTHDHGDGNGPHSH